MEEQEEKERGKEEIRKCKMLRKNFWCGNSEEFKKNGSVQMSQHKIFKEKKNRKKEKTKEYVDFSKQIKKWQQVRNTFLKSKRSM